MKYIILTIILIGLAIFSLGAFILSNHKEEIYERIEFKE